MGIHANYRGMPPLTVASIAEICNGRAEGDTERLISGANMLENATESELSFVATKKAVEAAPRSRAGCLIVPLSFEANEARTLIRCEDPRSAFAQALTVLYPRKRPLPFIHPTAIIGPSARVASSCAIGAYVTIGAGTHIEESVSIGNSCCIGEQVTVGPETVLYPNVTIYDNVRIGARVILHSGCVLGADGFGFTLSNGHYEKFPQVGIVEIEDDVEIGANSCVDRAALGVTRIRQGTKLDNLVHVGHNCDIGRHVVIAAQTGFSGSVTVGDYAVIGGQVGIGEKATIDANAIVGGKSGILTGQRVRAGEPVWGIPARPLRQHLKGLANVAKLSGLREEVREIKKKIAGR
jgi:UDP-3-O-[3-hydroxymyristoyl] glucosamine N-acyltransferase